MNGENPPNLQGIPRFLTFQDWQIFVANVQAGNVPAPDIYQLRRRAYSDIERLRGRPLLVYATHFLEALPGAPVSIDLTDIDGFTDLVNSLPGENAVDVLIHSPGGYPDAAERIVGLLRGRFQQVSFLVPHSAYSAGTMLVLSGDEVILHPSATLGPIDPQLGNRPARAIKRGFDRVRETLERAGPEALPAYVPLLEKISLELLEMCDDSLKLSQDLIRSWLTEYMFHGEEGREEAIEAIAAFFSDYDEHKTHSRPLTLDKIQHLGLKVSHADQELAQYLRETHIVMTAFFNANGFVKIYENNRGLSWGRMWQPRGVLPPLPGEE